MFSRQSKEKIIYNIIDNVEGGYVNDPNDPGGETNYGITVKVANAHKQELIDKFSWDGTMQNLSRAMAYYLYELLYWQVCGLDDISKYSWSIADNMFDIAVNMGTARAVRFLQFIVFAYTDPGNRADGVYGQNTFNAFEDMTNSISNFEKIINEGLLGYQNVHYVQLVNQRTSDQEYIHGWMNRTLKKTIAYFSDD